MRRASHGAIGRAFTTWKDIVVAIRRKLIAVCERVVRSSTRLLAAGWRTWITNALEGAHGSEMDRMTAELAALRQESKESRSMIKVRSRVARA